MESDYPNHASVECTDTFGKLCRRKVKFSQHGLEDLARKEIDRQKWTVAGATWKYEWYCERNSDDEVEEEGLIVIQTLEQEDPASAGKEVKP